MEAKKEGVDKGGTLFLFGRIGKDCCQLLSGWSGRCGEGVWEVAGVEVMGGFGTSSNPLRTSHSPYSRGRNFLALGTYRPPQLLFTMLFIVSRLRSVAFAFLIGALTRQGLEH